MFDIEYKGANCVIISTKKSKIVVDPKLSIVGLKDANVDDAIELVTDDRFMTKSPSVKLAINSPGEYGIAEFDIRGIAATRHIDAEKEGKMSTIYRLEIEETRIGILGNIYQKLSDDQLEELGVIDLLIIPVGGGGYTLDAKDATKLVKSIDPKIVIPVHYADSAIHYEVPQDTLAMFVEELGAPVETVSKYKFKPGASLSENLSIVEITRS